MNKILALVTLCFISIPLDSHAQQSYPYSCKWISEVTPDVLIQFTSTNRVGTYSGNLIYKGKSLMYFQEMQSQGYGSISWSVLRNNYSNPLVVFSGNNAYRGISSLQAEGNIRFLLVGLGSTLYYGQDSRWRQNSTLINAAEGFWRASSGCRSLLGR